MRGLNHPVHSENVLEAALAYAAAGHPVFPCRPDKSPFTKGGFKSATRDQGTIKKWWTKWPEAMIGMPTGSHPANTNDLCVIVLDVDRKNGADGFKTLEALALSPKCPELIAISQTPSGGAHFFFKISDQTQIQSSTGKLGPGLDVRADGGYVIVPPSRPSVDLPAYSWVSGHEFPTN